MKPGDSGQGALEQWLARLEGRHATSIDLDLSRCGTVYRRLGAPRPAQRVITVAGTNGKGSTVAWASSTLSLLGKRQGTYTSPHLMRFNERLRINGECVASATLVAAFEEVEIARGDTSLTFFEFTTLACLLIMSRSHLDVAVLEVGLGGRLDTVNLVDADVAVITPIGLDHQAYLGDDRETIGKEKAGILREETPLIISEDDPPRSVLDRARSLACPVLRGGRDFALKSPGEDQMCLRLGEHRYAFDAPSLAGAHQESNLAAGMVAALTVYPVGTTLPDAVARGLAGTRIPGRLEAVGQAPGYLVDVGHNPLAAEVVAGALAQEHDPRFCVLGMLKDKDAESVVQRLAPYVRAFLCAGIEDGSRGQSGVELAGRVKNSVGEVPVDAYATVDAALEEARIRADGHHGVLVFGSFHTAAEAFRWLRETGVEGAAESAHDRSPAC